MWIEARTREVPMWVHRAGAVGGVSPLNKFEQVHNGHMRSPRTDKQTGMTENITFMQLYLRAVISLIHEDNDVFLQD